MQNTLKNQKKNISKNNAVGQGSRWRENPYMLRWDDVQKFRCFNQKISSYLFHKQYTDYTGLSKIGLLKSANTLLLSYHFLASWNPSCQAHVWLYQKWYCNQSWGNCSDAVLSPTLEPADSNHLVDVLVRWWTVWFVHWLPFGSKCDFPGLLLRYFLIN